jgi:L-lactate dehydrogenase complex protein LldG
MEGTDTDCRQFVEFTQRAGAEVFAADTLPQALEYIANKTQGTTLVPQTPLAVRHGLSRLLQDAGVAVYAGDFRQAGQVPAAGVTFCNFAMADTGTVVLESTDENIRLATTLPEIHFVIVDPQKVLADNLAAVEPLKALHAGSEPCFVAYITGPSRTADIERVLTIGCHGPRELHILLVPSVSSDLMEI